MSYIIRKTNGTTLGTILDGTIDTSKTSLTLVGRNYSNYGQYMTDNLVKLIENFALGTSPSNPLAGQLWWDTSTSRLKVYTGTAFKVISSASAQATAPSTTVAGDLWWDTSNQQLYVYSGANPYDPAGWILVGPGYSVLNGKSGAIRETISDGTNNRNVTSIYLDGTRTAIISNVAFTPSPAITGFGALVAGYNMNSGYTIYGTANNASYLGNQPAANYLRSDTNDTTDGTLTISNNGGLTIGTSSNLQVTTSTGGNVNIRNTKSLGDINFYANVSGTDTLAFSLDGATGTASLLSASLSGNLTLGAGASVTGALNVTGTGSFSGNLTAPTQAAGTADTTVATTEFVVSGLSGLFPYKIYNGNTHVWVGSTSANIVVNNSTVATASASGIALNNGATAHTQTATKGNVAVQAGDTKVATTAYVRQVAQYWNGSAKFVSTAAPTSGDGENGDFWFQIES